MSNYSKLLVSLGTTATILSGALVDGSLSGAEIGVVSLSAFQAFLVWLVPNYTPPKDPA